MEYNFKELIAGIKNGEYKLIGSGSSRKVYDLNDGNVIKIAKDVRGIYQNQAENKIYLSHKSKFFAQIVAVSDDNKCLIMPKAGKIKNIHTVYRYYNVKNINSLVMVDNFYHDIKNNSLGKGDLIRPSSWGYIGDVPVMIDYGLTRGIYKKYYGLNLIFKKFRKLHYT